ncbi:hypothetical protein E4K65_21235 [Bradyrhizobium niftali]|uniref:Uncharacterized protein n=1 Tax=Bradyrhizobium niftali TaxID=2560055 RepID=A0A4Y9LU94_9BRAD|nr:hypothetical protein E4K65_21235 [Bradyrhizobium niftali]
MNEVRFIDVPFALCNGARARSRTSVAIWFAGRRRSHIPPSCPAKAGHPVRRGLSAQPLLSRNTGSPGQAGRRQRAWRQCASPPPVSEAGLFSSVTSRLRPR